MRVSAKTEYACIAMLELAAQCKSGEPVQIWRIAKRHGTPSRFLVHILLQLKGAGLVTSVRGTGGGYQLTRPPQDISLGEIMRIVDGRFEANQRTDGNSSSSPIAKVLTEAWKEVATVQHEMLDAISLADLLEQAQTPVEQMFYI
jgi:Rrf2 family protein